ncbi:guanine nucleotide-binding protein subunit gamma 2 [Manihot esculenta]|uniref:G protein gamma domain-containing protein n=1 Tax=Manihot esculenta TaxID=3983 RepID=A0A2C9WEV8_MANES|nr:guanine nucleotide-binding protein subunit gamma 2 [Manihot esculenta]OAY58295.1 hypothetical protein MANES_02G165500v8 [Manihot esculenta]
MEQDSAPMDDPLSSPAKPRREDQHTPSPSTLLPKTQSNGFLGKHRMAAAISNLQNQINFLQEELDQLDELGEASIVCKELISSVESIPDPLLPLSKGPTNISWDRWFRGAQNSRKRWI